MKDFLLSLFFFSFLALLEFAESTELAHQDDFFTDSDGSVAG